MYVSVHSSAIGIASSVRVIPLYIKTTVTAVVGKKRVEAVKLAEVDDNRQPIPGTERTIECDTLILSVGLIPENEVASTCGIRLNNDCGTETDPYLQTSVDGIFSCGNSRKVCDLADYVSEQGELAGRNAVKYLSGFPMEPWDESRTNCMKKGFPDENTVTCPICPNGCQVRYDMNSESYSGNLCPRGEVFARQEMTDPVRSVTTTVKTCRNLLPVKSSTSVRQCDVKAVVQATSMVHIDGDNIDRFAVSIIDGSTVEMRICKI